jgi:two-component system CheB/CheR fusion protein
MPDRNPPSIIAPGEADTAPPSGARSPLQIQNGFAVVGIGASAGGLEACTKLLAALPPGSGKRSVSAV